MTSSEHLDTPRFNCGKCGVVHIGYPSMQHPEDVTGVFNFWLVLIGILIVGCLIFGVSQ